MDILYTQNLLEIKALSEKFGIEVRFVQDEAYLGQADLQREIIYLGTIIFFNRVSALSVFFHEYSHILCARRRRFPAYHNWYLSDLGVESWRAFNRQLLRAERYVDNMAAEMLKEYDPSLTYETSYITMSDLLVFYSENPYLPYQEWLEAMRHLKVYGLDDLLEQNS